MPHTAHIQLCLRKAEALKEFWDSIHQKRMIGEPYFLLHPNGTWQVCMLQDSTNPYAFQEAIKEGIVYRLWRVGLDGPWPQDPGSLIQYNAESTSDENT